MVRADNSDLDQPKHVAAYCKLVGIQSGLLVQTLSYNDVKRMVVIDDEHVEAGDDPLASLLVDGLEALESDDASIQPIGSIAALFDAGSVQRSLKPRLFAAFSLRDGVTMVGAVVACVYSRDEALGTNLFSHSYCSNHSLPRFDARWGFIDVISAQPAGKPAGSLLTLHAILAAHRAKLTGVCAVAATAAGHRLLRALNFTCVAYREHGSQRYMCYLRLPQDLSFAHVKRKLRFDGDTDIVESVCWRDSLSARALSSVVGRC